MACPSQLRRLRIAVLASALGLTATAAIAAAQTDVIRGKVTTTEGLPLPGVRVTATLPGDLVPARANPEKIQRVLFNLIQNAIRHTPADGSVVVRAEPSAAGVEIEVADTGSGIGPADRARVFTAFYRGGSEAARSGEGAGLGLAVSRAIVEAHGGRIWLANSAEGTRVRFKTDGKEGSRNKVRIAVKSGDEIATPAAAGAGAE